MIIRHEALARAIDQIRPFAAHGFGDQRPARSGDIQRRRMKLHHLHVLQRRAGAIRHRVAVGGGDLGIGGLAIKLPRAAAGENRPLGPDDVNVPVRSTRSRRRSGFHR